MMAPKHVQVLIPRTRKYVALHGKKDFVDGIWLRTLRWELIPVGPLWP